MTKQTPLYQQHLSLGGRIVDFAGYSLPVQYESTGIIAEHNAVRNAVGMFDVSHMGEFHVHGVGSEATLNYLLSNDISRMQDKRVMYALLCNEEGKLIDDLMVYKYKENDYLLVVNASNREKDFAWMSERILADTVLDDVSDETGQIALQGPQAPAIMQLLFGEELIALKHQTFTELDFQGENCLISRTGYTGEDGYELYIAPKALETLWTALLHATKDIPVLPCGLGARDTLRFEANMPLYGHEMTEEIFANEVGLDFAIKLEKENFIGKEAIVKHTPVYERRGVKLLKKGVAREGFKVFSQGEEVGYVTSGTFSVTNNCALAILRIKKGITTPLELQIRKKMIPVEFIKLPFIEKRNN